MEKRRIYFNEELHSYTDELGFVYTSTTTLISKYYDKFKSAEIARACARIGRNPGHPDYLKYKGKSEKQLIYEWETTKDVACAKGTKKHNYFEDVVRTSTGYKLIAGNFINGHIYTLDDVIGDRRIGLINIEYFEQHGIKDKYPIIFNIIYELTKIGFLIYAEIGVYDSVNYISGLIDIIMIKGNDFIIIDWKTNAAPIMFETGYFKKDNLGNITNNFIYKDEYFNSPLSYLPSSVGNKYSLQLSGYANLTEGFGLNYKGMILCHIRTLPTGMIGQLHNVEQEEVKVVPVVDLRSDFIKLKEHHYNLNHLYQPKTTLF
jgi:hypothetical protein